MPAIFTFGAGSARGMGLNVSSETTPPPTDEYWDNVVLLTLQDNGANGSTSFTDQKNARTITTVGDFVWSNVTAPAGLSTSGRGDGTGDWLSLADNTDWDFPTGNCTIEFDVSFASTPGATGFIGQSNGGGSQPKWAVYWSPPVGGMGNRLVMLLANPDNWIVCTANWIPSSDTWYKIAVTRSGDDWRFFVDGVQIGDAVNNTLDPPASSSDLRIGADGENWQRFNGYTAGVRLTSGIARYTGNYTVPTLPYPTAGP